MQIPYKHIILLCLLIGLHNPIYAGPTSINQYSQNGIDSSEIYNKWAEDQTITSPQRAQINADKALTLSVQSNNKEQQAIALSTLGTLAYDRLEYTEALAYFKQSLNTSKENHLDRLSISAIMKLVRWYRYRTKDYPKAISYLQESLEISKSTNYSYGEAKSYVQLANISAQQKNTELALEYLQLSHKPYLKLNLEEDIAHYYNQVGEQIWKYDNKRAVEVFQKGLEFYNNYPDLELSMGKAYQNVNKPKEAYEYCVSALNTYVEKKDLRRQGIALSHLGESLISLSRYQEADSVANLSIELLKTLSPRQQTGIAGAYRVKGKVDITNKSFNQAFTNFNTSRNISDILDENDELAESYLLLGELHLNHLNDPVKAIKYCNSSKELSLKESMITKQKYSCDCLYRSYQQVGNYKAALNSFQEYQTLKDSTNLFEFKQNIDSLSSVFIAKSNLALKNQELKSQSLMNKALGALVLIGLTFIAFLYTSIRRLAEKNKIINRQNQEIENKTQVLTELNATKTKILAVIGHDIKGPVRTLRSFLDLMIAGRLTKESFMDIAGNLRNNTTAVFETLDNLLNWSKIEMSGSEIDPQPVDIQKEILQVQSLLQPTLDQKEIKFTIDLPDNFKLQGSEESINLILRNLISNAIKFTPKGGAINVSAEDKTTYGIVSIIDDGMGIAEDDLAKLFESRRTTYGTDNEKGTGIGLNLCKSIIDSLGGQIYAENNSTKGSRFSFTLPIT